MVKNGVSGKFTFVLIIMMLLVFSFRTTSSAQNSSNSCLDCHISVEKLKKITTELEKKKPAKSAETSGEG
jgi:nitrate/TMAO reductase-like tetraheme cytochrome c subunit